VGIPPPVTLNPFVRKYVVSEGYVAYSSDVAIILMKRKAQGSASELRSYDGKKPRKRAKNHTYDERMTLENGKTERSRVGRRETESWWI
jgi:formate dehydrogenase assembly factor FdhD